MLNFLRNIFGTTDFESIGYWRKRASEYGNRSVLNTAYGESDVEQVTQSQKNYIFPVVTKYSEGISEPVVLLDFGCGPGRFTRDLSVLVKGKAVGIDPVESFIRFAKEKDTGTTNEYSVMRDYTIPFPDNTFNILWVCLVLGGIPDKKLSFVVNELNRVSTNNAILILTENTTNQKNNVHWFYRSAEYYKKIFDQFSLSIENSYNELGEQITILGGAKR
jgi:ubiquinone/menaquinone biosynthesis C-methylase UbiE